MKISSRKKKTDIFLIFAQDIDCGNSLEPPRTAAMTFIWPIRPGHFLATDQHKSLTIL